MGAVEDEGPHNRAPELAQARQPGFAEAKNRGRLLDTWDAVAIALGELELPQTVP